MILAPGRRHDHAAHCATGLLALGCGGCGIAHVFADTLAQPLTELMAGMDPVQTQLDAYNARDLEQFLACYAEEVVIENANGQRLIHGREAMREAYGALFANNPDLHAEVPTRIRVGEFVIDEELVTGMKVPGLPPVLRSAVVYRVRDGLIMHVRLLT